MGGSIPSWLTLFSHQMENKLDEIAGGRMSRVEYLSDFYLGEEGLRASVDKKTRTINRFEAKRARLPGLEVICFSFFSRAIILLSCFPLLFPINH